MNTRSKTTTKPSSYKQTNTRSKTAKTSSYIQKKGRNKREPVNRRGRRKKPCCVFVTDAMNKSDVLFPVFEYVGRGQYLFLCSVSKLWQSIYLQARDQEWECGEFPTTTYISNAIETQEKDGSCKKLEWSVKTGALNLAKTRVMFTFKGTPGQPPEEKEQPAAFVVGAVSSNLQSLVQALELGMPWNELVLDGSIRMSNVKLLQSLGSSPVINDDDDDTRAIALKYALKWKKRKRKDPFLLPVIYSASGLCQTAARYADNNVLLWLHKRFSQSMIRSSAGMHIIAAHSGRVEVSDLLCALDIPPPEDVPLIFAATISNQIKYIEWALSEGIPWRWRGAQCTKARILGATQSTLDVLHTIPGYPCDCGLL